jgi:UDP-2,3-diacylglucosamine hydrolase
MTPSLHKGKAQPDLVALFASDVHLSPALPLTTEAFLQFLTLQACRARQLYLLGDLFEYWAGDDDLDDPYHQRICQAIRAVAEQGTAVFWMPGNRDFLTGQSFADACALQILAEPAIVALAGHHICLAHGDAECTDDLSYMAFRRQVRQAEWQQAFLVRPLAERRAIIAGMREQSQLQQQDKSYQIMDVNAEAIHRLFTTSSADTVIHGHTHRPRWHQHRMGRRYVLPDWACEQNPPRGGWLALLNDGGFQFQTLDQQHHLQWPYLSPIDKE